MDSTISLDFGVSCRPPCSRNWFDSLLVRLHITPPHIRKYVRNEFYIKGLLEDIAGRCNNIGLLYSIKVDWENEYISFWQFDNGSDKSLYQEISFNEFLSKDFDPEAFVELMLKEKNLLEYTS